MTPTEAYDIGRNHLVAASHLEPGLGRHWVRGVFERAVVSHKLNNLVLRMPKAFSDLVLALLQDELYLFPEVKPIAAKTVQLNIKGEANVHLFLTWIFTDSGENSRVWPMHENRHYVYLAGPMLPPSTDSYYLEWRLSAVKSLKRHGITALNPFHTDENVGMDPTGVTSNIPPGTVFQKDYWMVRASNVILANLTINGKTGKFPRSVTGTFYELGIAWDRNLPIYAVIEADNRNFRNHPFIISTSKVIASSVTDAVRSIVRDLKP